MAISYGTYTITDEMDGSQFWTTATAPTTPDYTFTISNLTGDGNTDIKVGDIIFQGIYRYTVTEVGTTTVKAGTRQSLQGATGTAGLNNATVTLYKRGTSSPALPTGNVTYTFSSGTASGSLNGWTQAIPTGTDPLYAIYAVASSNTASDTIGASEWKPNPATVVMENGVNGDDGYNQATIYLYQRKSGTAPSKPSASVTYTFATGDLSSVPSGWSRSIPSGTDPCYVTTAVAVSKEATYTITSSSWADVVKLAEDGISPDPLTVSSTKYQSGTSNTTAPTGTWSDSPVTVAEGNYLWTKVTYSDGSYSYSVAKQGKSGTNGTSVTVTSTVYAYQLSTSGTTVPTGTWQSTPQAPTTTQYAWTRTTTTFSDNSQAITYTVGGKTGEDGEDGKMLYGTCPDTAIGTAAKVVACTDATELYAGLAITIKFTNGNTASAPTLNVNGLGAKNIYFGGANASSTNLFIFAANSEIQFVYNGTAFVPIGYPCSYYGSCATAAGTAAKTTVVSSAETVPQAVICKGTVVNLQMTNATSVANPTLNVGGTGAKAIYANGARPTADSPYNWIASSTVSFTFDGQYWRLGDTSSLNKIDVVNTLAQSAKDTADSKVTTYYSASTSTPSNPSEGDLWIKTDDNNSLWRWNGTSWVSVDNTNIQTALTNAATAQSTADGKIVTYAQDEEPLTGSLGDLWIDTDDNNKLYRHNGTIWIEVAPEILIGGRNLIIGTLYPDARGGGIYRPHLPEQLVNTSGRGTCTVAEHGLKFTCTSANWQYIYFGASGNTATPDMLGLEAGETYTLSADLSWNILSSDTGKADTTTYYMGGMLVYSNADKPTTWVSATRFDPFPITQADKGTDMSGRLEFTFTVPSDAIRLYLGIRSNNTTTSHYAAGDYIEARNMKLEKGNIATGWTPAPEDLETSITAAQNTATTALESANGKNQVFYQVEAPVGGTYKSGDTWFKMGTTLEDATKTGDIVTFDGSGSVRSIVVNIDPVQSGSGDPSPSNVRPITGHDSVNVTRTGKNLFDRNNLITYTGYLGGASAGSYCKYFSYSNNLTVVTPVFKAGIYTISRQFALDRLRVAYGGTTLTNGENAGIMLYNSPDNSSASYTFTLPIDANLQIYLKDTAETHTADEILRSIQIEVGSTATAYEDYDGTTYPVSFSSAGTVYGGTVDVVSGELTVDTVTAQIGSYNWTDRISSQGRVYTLATNILPSAPYVYDSFASLSADEKNLCDKLPMTNTVSNPDSASITIGVNDYIYLNGVTHIDASVTDKASLNTWLTANPLQVTFRLATPQTYQLTPAQIALLTGTNVMWADAGNITVTGTIEESEAAVEVYQWNETNSQWELTPYGSEVFASIDAGKITTGQLSTILIKSNNDDYWNLSGVDIVKDGKTYKANTLETGHIAARDDIVAIGNNGSGQIEVTSGGIRAMSTDSGEVMTARSSDILITSTYVHSLRGNHISAAGATDTVELPTITGDFEIRVEYGATSFRKQFTVGTSASYNISYSSVFTGTLVYNATDNTVTLTIITNTTSMNWYAAIVSCKYTIQHYAPYFTFGTREGSAGGYSIAGGSSLYATQNYQTVLGKYNIEEDGASEDAALIIGNGTQDDIRSDAFKFGWDGDIGFYTDSNVVGSNDEEILRLIMELQGNQIIPADYGYGRGLASIKELLMYILTALVRLGSFGFSNDTVINAGSNATITIPSPSTHLMVVTSGASAQRGMYMVTCTNTNTTTYTAMHNISTLTITTNTNGTINVANSGSQAVRLNFMTMQGNTI